MSIERYEVVMNHEDEREIVGYLEIDPENIDIFDVALSPVVTVDPDPEAGDIPHLEAWQLHLRTTLDTRPRRREAPYDHLDDGEQG